MIDPAYKRILYTGVFLKIRAEEIVWGGVKLEGIPPIDKPDFIGAAEERLSSQINLKSGNQRSAKLNRCQVSRRIEVNGP